MHLFLGVAVCDVSICACEPGAYCLQHPDAAHCRGTSGDVTTWGLWNFKVKCFHIKCCVTIIVRKRGVNIEQPLEIGNKSTIFIHAFKNFVQSNLFCIENFILIF